MTPNLYLESSFSTSEATVLGCAHGPGALLFSMSCADFVVSKQVNLQAFFFTRCGTTVKLITL